jgi:glycine/D-amino acid oxidase-like deaminating enzyme
MSSDSGSTTSFWMEYSVATFPPLTEDRTTTVCIVGAGIAGLSTAYHLALQGQDVIVLDDGAIGSGETGRTTAHLSNAFDDRYHRVESQHGEEVSRAVAQSHTAAIDRIEAVVRDERIDCDFRRRTRLRMNSRRNWQPRIGPDWPRSPAWTPRREALGHSAQHWCSRAKHRSIRSPI